MAKWIDYSVDERGALIAKVAKAKNIDQTAAEKDWWVTAVLYAVFHTSAADYLLFKGLCVAIHKPFMSSKRLCVVTFCKVLVSCPLARRLPSDTTHNIRRI